MITLNSKEGKFLTYITLFFIGFVTVSIQFLFIRQVLPFFGSSAPVVSVVISLFLAALAVGLKVGGRVKKDHLLVLRRNLVKGAVFLGFGCSYYFTHTVFTYLFQSSFDYPILILLIYLALSMAPAVYYLEQSVPILINFLGAGRHARLAGNAFKIATWGNISGGALTSLIVMQYLGVGYAVFLNGFILVLISAILSKSKWTILFYSMLIGAPIFAINVFTEQVLFTKTTEYANYSIYEDENGKKLISNLSFSSKLDHDGTILPYAEYIHDIIFNELETKNKDILVLGAGGFTLSRGTPHQNAITYIDIDQSLKPLIEDYFLEESINDTFIAQDARAFLSQSHEKKWDIVVVDVFSGMNSIPSSLLTHQFFELLKLHVAPGGYILFNFLMKHDYSSDYSRGFDLTIKSVYSKCLASPISHSNVVYVCQSI